LKVPKVLTNFHYERGCGENPTPRIASPAEGGARQCLRATHSNPTSSAFIYPYFYPFGGVG